MKDFQAKLGYGVWQAFVAVFILAAPPLANADTWSPGNTPTLVGSILLSGGNPLPSGGTIVMIEGDTLTLSVSSSDKDTLTPASGAPDPNQVDGAEVVWSATNGGACAPARVASGANTTITPPAIPGGATSITFTVTAQPDDDSIANPGGPLNGHGGNRNDDPGLGSTITIKVIKECPTGISVTSTCTGPTNWANFWTANPTLKSFGLTVARHTVSGGTPPNPPGNWNGLVISEVVSPRNDGTGVAADFNGWSAAIECQGSSSWVLGGAGPSLLNCVAGATDNSLWDFHIHQRGTLTLKTGTASKTLKCDQKFKCKNTEIGAYVFTGTYTNEGAGAAERTKVTFSY